MKLYKTKRIKTAVLEQVVCNKCGIKSLEKDWEFGYFSVEYTFDYFSKYDQTQISFELCEKCLIKFVKAFKIKCKGIK